MHNKHPHYMGNQVPPSLPVGVLADMVSMFIHNSLATFYGAPAQVVIEKRMVRWMLRKTGYSENSGGILTSGGSLANLTALLAARQIKSKSDIWTHGLKENLNLAIMTSEDAHYSIRKAMQIMGIGAKGLVPVKTAGDFSIDTQALHDAYNSTVENGKQVIALVGSACNTGPGVFDNLNLMADFCESKDLWFHVDGAHGAPTVLSEKYKYLVAGIERADSIVWDLHKMMALPGLATGLLFKDRQHSYKAINQEAPYLYDKIKRDPKDSFMLSQRTVECTKPAMGFKLFLSLAYYGEDFFGNLVTHLYDLARTLADLLKKDPDMELLLEPMSNIVCFRYKPEGIDIDEPGLNALQEIIHRDILESGKFFTVKTTLKGKTVLRTALMNPKCEQKYLQDLINCVKETGKRLLPPAAS
ncbi:MAG: aspartate aminotransferase family protein [bacterium]|nr:aspartate aminotransferase family protein [bacterium]